MTEKHIKLLILIFLFSFFLVATARPGHAGEVTLSPDHRLTLRVRDTPLQQVLQKLAEQGVRVEEAGDRPADDAGDQQQQDGRQLEPPGEPLAGDPDDADGGQRDQCVLEHPFPRPSRLSTGPECNRLPAPGRTQGRDRAGGGHRGEGAAPRCARENGENGVRPL